ncbi:MAG TPA: type I methionyl aminopeptidase [Desulfobulbaceae bacterium]|nr:type I methionyl aminopeptidase [Desulfobulbaceae bacterium]
MCGASASGGSILIKTRDEISRIRDANRIVAHVLSGLSAMIEPGISTYELDRMAERMSDDMGAKPAFKGYRGFPSALCISLNEEVVHGIPSKKRVLRLGDVVSLDFGVLYRGFYGDSAVTVGVGQLSPRDQQLLHITESSLRCGVSNALPGNRISDISRAIQKCVEKEGFSIVRDFVGHGIGRSLHEPPEIPNYVMNAPSPRMRPGMVLAIEPMVNSGDYKVRVLRDGWTVVTSDGSRSAHFEHSVAITEDGCEVLSARD